jgi:hypothetical protein
MTDQSRLSEVVTPDGYRLAAFDTPDDAQRCADDLEKILAIHGGKRGATTCQD